MIIQIRFICSFSINHLEIIPDHFGIDSIYLVIISIHISVFPSNVFFLLSDFLYINAHITKNTTINARSIAANIWKANFTQNNFHYVYIVVQYVSISKQFKFIQRSLINLCYIFRMIEMENLHLIHFLI